MIGIETVKQAVVDANRNAVINGIVNAIYVCGRAEEELPKMEVSADVAILDRLGQVVRGAFKRSGQSSS